MTSHKHHKKFIKKAKEAKKQNIFQRVFNSIKKLSRTKAGLFILSGSLLVILGASLIGAVYYTQNQDQKSASAAGCAAGGYVLANTVSSEPSSGPNGSFIYPNNNVCVRTSGSILPVPGTTTWTDQSGRQRYYPAGTGYNAAGCLAGFSLKSDVNGPGQSIVQGESLQIDNSLICVSSNVSTCPYYGWTGTGAACNVLKNTGIAPCPSPYVVKSNYNFGATISFPQSGTLAGQQIPNNNVCFYPSGSNCPTGGLNWIGTGGNCNKAINYTPTCLTGYTWNGSNCVVANCTNGATNPPTCNQFPPCTNGTINPPTCNQCPSGQSIQGGRCQPTLPTTCSAGQYLNGSSCVPCPVNTYKTTTEAAQSECLSCPTGSTSPAGSTSAGACACPSGYQIVANACVKLTIPNDLIGDSTDCTVNLIVNIGSTFNCTFPILKPYTLPAGTTANVENLAGSGNCVQATILGSSNQVINCTGIPTAGGTVGLKNVILNIHTFAPTPKGKVTLARSLTSTNIGNSTDCIQTKQVIIGDVFTCTFPVTTTDTVYLPNGTTANVTTGNNLSDNCTLDRNAKIITCTNIPTNGTQPGIQGIILNIPSQIPTEKGKVTLVVADPILLTSSSLAFSPTREQAKKFKDGDLTLTVSDTRILEGASCVFSLSQYPSKAQPATQYANLSQKVYTNGSASIILPAASQLVPKWRFKVECTNPNTNSNTAYLGRKFIGVPDYAMKYGSIAVVEITAKTL